LKKITFENVSNNMILMAAQRLKMKTSPSISATLGKGDEDPLYEIMPE